MDAPPSTSAPLPPPPLPLALRIDCDAVASGGDAGTPTPNALLSPVLQLPPPEIAAARVVVLTLNDVYELFPNGSGQGGVAEFATLLNATKARLPTDAHVVVTLNGDFLWRSELDREDKGALMVEVLNALGVEFVVLGNHEFDFGGELLAELLRGAKFTSFGSNIRQRGSNALFPGLVDFEVVNLQNGVKMGIFGVSTTVTGKDPFAGDHVVFESEVPHARRCVEALQELGADLIVALTHFKLEEDKALVAQVPGIHLVLGGHDHEVMSVFSGDTLIHKSGQDALWLGVVDIHVEKTSATYDKSATVAVDFQWQMLCNRGYAPEPGLCALLLAYAARVHAEAKAQGKLERLAVSRTILDGCRASCRTHETNLGNLVADALRKELGADVAVLNAGFLKGDQLHDAGLEINAQWLEKFLPLRKPPVVVPLSVRDLTGALTKMLRKFPQMSSSFPQISGFALRYDANARAITSLSFADGSDDPDRQLRVATVCVPSMDGWDVLAKNLSVEAAATARDSGALVRLLVGAFVKRQGGEIAYPASEARITIWS
ncbi:hypothetical protein PybrP1_003034 [[Pythium] brassicae (nom. inval.)]|nr:hypothetical protein PybrP1_003034 [[Pythium] brassicae (nom. inval.)]